MSPVARKLAKLANESQSTMRKLKYLIGDVQELEWALKANSLKGLNEEDVFNVQPEDTGGSHPKDLSNGKKRQSRHDEVGQSGNRRGSATRHRTRRPRNKRKKFEKGAKAL
jgi:hypothetical protein